jgi:hypothetical protein
VSLTTPIAALTNPRSGSTSYMTLQITPVARNEMAMGMKTMILIAVEYLTRSVRIANIRPSPVMIAGAVATQTALFLIARVTRSVSSNRW